MKKIDSALPPWLEDYHTLYPEIHVKMKRPWDGHDDAALTLALTCPPIFEAYAIVLHPFWIHYKGKELAKNGVYIEVDSLKDEDFSRVPWKAFFLEKGCNFLLKTAFTQLKRLEKEVWDVNDEWPEYCWFPAEGDCEVEELLFMLSEVNKICPEVKVNYHYNLLRTVSWNQDLQYRGSIDYLEQLASDREVRGTPSSIYPDDKSWYIGSNYDSTFTCVGGPRELIDSIKQNKKFEIFELPYLVKPEN